MYFSIHLLCPPGSLSWLHVPHACLTLKLRFFLQLTCTEFILQVFCILMKVIQSSSVPFSSVAQSCPTLCNPMNCSMPGFPVHHSPGVHSNSHPLSQWCHPAISSSVVPFTSCPQISPSIRVFSNESTLCMRWPKYWSFSFSIIPSKEIPRLISFRMIQTTQRTQSSIRRSTWAEYT